MALRAAAGCDVSADKRTVLNLEAKMPAKRDDDNRRPRSARRKPMPVLLLLAGVIGIMFLMWLVVNYSGMLSLPQ